MDFEEIKLLWEGRVDEAHAAAEKGDVTAQHYLGRLAFDAPEGRRNYAEARRWFQLAAAKGFSNSETMLGNMDFNGWGGEKNIKTALDWYVKAAGHGGALAAMNLAELKLKGQRVPKDEKAGLDWLFRADALGHGAAGYELHQYFREKGEALTLKQRTAILQRGADQGSPVAQYDLAEIYARGDGAPRNEADQPLTLYDRAARQGHRDANWALARRFLAGYAVQRDFVKAACYARRAYGVVTEPQVNIVRRGSDGKMRPFPTASPDPVFLAAENRARAIGREDALWSETAVLYCNFMDKGDATAATAIGNLYVSGRGVPVDLMEAYAWYQTALQMGDQSAAALGTGIKDKLTPADLEKAAARSRQLL